MKTLWDWQSLSILRSLNKALERLATLQDAGVNVPYDNVEYARDELLRILIGDTRAEQITEAGLLADAGLPTPGEIVPPSPAVEFSDGVAKESVTA